MSRTLIFSLNINPNELESLLRTNNINCIVCVIVLPANNHEYFSNCLKKVYCIREKYNDAEWHFLIDKNWYEKIAWECVSSSNENVNPSDLLFNLKRLGTLNSAVNIENEIIFLNSKLLFFCWYKSRADNNAQEVVSLLNNEDIYSCGTEKHAKWIRKVSEVNIDIKKTNSISVEKLMAVLLDAKNGSLTYRCMKGGIL